MQEQIDLIKAIPLRAAERAQKLAQEAIYNGTRASEVAAELARSGTVSQNDAERIARTEVARANSVITQTRAQAAGSRQYIWRNSGDASVREAHMFRKGKKLDGQVFSWDEPPTLDDGTVGHPGTFPNCRCYPEPFFPEE
jgi:SPP1 gp7 family putative phage head morphogenesis protein